MTDRELGDLVNVLVDRLERAGHIAPQNRSVVCVGLIEAMQAAGYTIKRTAAEQRLAVLFNNCPANDHENHSWDEESCVYCGAPYPYAEGKR